MGLGYRVLVQGLGGFRVWVKNLGLSLSLGLGKP